MNLLQIFFILSGIGIFFLAFRVGKAQRFNALHFSVFMLGGISLFVFALFPQVLAFIGALFGMERGAEVLVYMSIVFLFYFSMLLLKKTETNREEISKLVRAIAIDNAHHAKK